MGLNHGQTVNQITKQPIKSYNLYKFFVLDTF
jgi:hypothetical protein